MTFTMIFNLFPLIFIGLTSFALMFAAAIRRSRIVPFWISMFGVLAAFVISFFITDIPASVTTLFTVDGYGLFSIRLLLLSVMVILIFSFEGLKDSAEPVEEFYILLLISVIGALAMVISNHFFTFFLGLELLTVPVYALVAYFPKRHSGVEAGIKFVILAGASAAFLLFGMALMYAKLGTMRFDQIAERIGPMWASGEAILLFGIAFIMVGIFFKASIVPFHMWAPDVYEGAPLPVTAYLTTVSKGAMIILFLRFFDEIHGGNINEWVYIVTMVCFFSMLVGNLLALKQKSVKRLLAFSSIAHVGYMLLAVVAGGRLGTEAVLYYLMAYFAASLLGFGGMMFVETKDNELIEIESLKGLFYVKPIASLAIVISFLSMLGIPLTAGFIGKYWILISGITANAWGLIFWLVCSTILGMYAYLRVALIIFQRPQTSPELVFFKRPSLEFLLVVLFLLVISLGIIPDVFSGFFQDAVLS